MNKAELVVEIQKQLGPECSRAHAERVLQALLASIQQGLRQDGEVQIVGFGTFVVKDRKARTGRNPQTNEPIAIQASRSVGFRPSTKLKDLA
jgi:DNA-binding protein HU-beta